MITNCDMCKQLTMWVYSRGIRTGVKVRTARLGKFREQEEGYVGCREEQEAVLSSLNSRKLYAKCHRPRRHCAHCASLYGDHLLLGEMVINRQKVL